MAARHQSAEYRAREEGLVPSFNDVRGGLKSEIYRVGLDGALPVRLTAAEGFFKADTSGTRESYPAFTRDGTCVLLVSDRAAEFQYSVWRTSADGKVPAAVATKYSYTTWPQALGAAGAVVFLWEPSPGRDKPACIMRVATDGGEAEQLFPPPPPAKVDRPGGK